MAKKSARVAVLAAAMLTGPAVGCAFQGSSAFCGKLEGLADDIRDGDIESTEELLERVQSLGDPGGALSARREGLERLIERGDESLAAERTHDLLDLCQELSDVGQ